MTVGESERDDVKGNRVLGVIVCVTFVQELSCKGTCKFIPRIDAEQTN